MKKVAIIAGAGPAGLTAALELLRRTDVRPVVFEVDGQVGGISKTIVYRGNRMDLGGHRFFSKSDWVMRWWQDILPIAEDAADAGIPLDIRYQNQTARVSRAAWTARRPAAATATTAEAEGVLLVRPRLSRIFYRRRFFDYPLKLNGTTLRNLGLAETLRIAASYAQAQLTWRPPENTLEEFFINRFGERLYRTFFKDYTEKVWGVPCRDISADWGAQRIKGLSVFKALSHALTTAIRGARGTAWQRTETSLIERFLYPKLGPGQMWEAAARRITERGGRIDLGHRIVGIHRARHEITALDVLDVATNELQRVPCDYFISTLPVQQLVAFLQPDDAAVARIAAGLPYRDFLTVGLLVRRMRNLDRAGRGTTANGMPPDNWIYIQEPDVRIGRLQIFNNWSPAMVADPATIWLGLEYFCREGDDLWSMQDQRLIDFAAAELETLGLIERGDVLDGTVVRVPKAYPAYFGEYRDFDQVRDYLESFANLYPIGRNGMHRYNNQDHSMLAAKGAVDSILDAGRGKAAIWSINAEDEYHEDIGQPVTDLT